VSSIKIYSFYLTKFCTIFSILVDRLGEEKSQLSYIGVALNREHSIYWIAHIKKLLWICCLYLDNLSPELAADSRSMLLFLRTLVAFTSTSNWVLLKAPAMEKLKLGMNKLCANIIGDLVTKGFLNTLKVTYFLYYKFKLMCEFFLETFN